MSDNVRKFPLEQNESGDFLPGHANEDIDEIGQSDQLATDCDRHGHLWDPKTGDCIEEGCEANYFKQDPARMAPKDREAYFTQKYYDKKMEHRYEMLPFLATLFLIGLVMVVIAYFFNL